MGTTGFFRVGCKYPNNILDRSVGIPEESDRLVLLYDGPDLLSTGTDTLLKEFKRKLLYYSLFPYF